MKQKTNANSKLVGSYPPLVEWIDRYQDAERVQFPLLLCERDSSLSLVIVWFAFTAIPGSRENTFRVLSLSLGNFLWYSFVSWLVLLRPCRARSSGSSKMMPQRCTDTNSMGNFIHIRRRAIFSNWREGPGTEVAAETTSSHESRVVGQLLIHVPAFNYSRRHDIIKLNLVVGYFQLEAFHVQLPRMKRSKSQLALSTRKFISADFV